MTGDTEYRDWLAARRSAEVPEGFSGRVMAEVEKRGRKVVAATLMALAAAAFAVRVASVLGVLLGSGGIR